MEGHKEMASMLKMTQIEFLEYCIGAMKENNLTFMFFDIKEIEDVEKTRLYFESKNYEVLINEETFKVLWT